MANEATSINTPAPSIPALRKTRIALNEAVDDGAEYLRGLRDEVEAELIERLARARREREAVTT